MNKLVDNYNKIMLKYRENINNNNNYDNNNYNNNNNNSNNGKSISYSPGNIM